MKKMCLVIIVVLVILGSAKLVLNFGTEEIKEKVEIETVAEKYENEVLTVDSVEEVNAYQNVEKEISEESKNLKTFTAVMAFVSFALIVSFIYEIKA